MLFAIFSRANAKNRKQFPLKNFLQPAYSSHWIFIISKFSPMFWPFSVTDTSYIRCKDILSNDELSNNNWKTFKPGFWELQPTWDYWGQSIHFCPGHCKKVILQDSYYLALKGRILVRFSTNLRR